MVEFALPKNSKITSKYTSIDTHYVDPSDCGPMVLDGLTLTSAIVSQG